MDWILTPPFAFLIYLPLVGIITLVGKWLAGPEKKSDMKSSMYGSGELAPTNLAAPGYRPFFLVAFFFAILHLGMLVLGSGNARQLAHPPGPGAERDHELLAVNAEGVGDREDLVDLRHAHRLQHQGPPRCSTGTRSPPGRMVGLPPSGVVVTSGGRSTRWPLTSRS